MKYITFVFSNGEKWGVPAHIIARDRAAFYADVDARDNPENYQKTYDHVYQEEFEYTMNDQIEAVDWLRNNTHYADIEHDLIRLERSSWTKADFFEEAMRNGIGIILEDIENA